MKKTLAVIGCGALGSAIARAAAKELKESYTLDEALKLYALYQMENDVEAGHLEELRAEGGGSR